MKCIEVGQGQSLVQAWRITNLRRADHGRCDYRARAEPGAIFFGMAIGQRKDLCLAAQGSDKRRLRHNGFEHAAAKP